MSVKNPNLQKRVNLDEGHAAMPVDVNSLVVEVFESAPVEQKDRMISQLVAKVYKEAPLLLRLRLLQQLVKPLGILSLVAVANGIFTKIRFHSALPDPRVQLEDVSRIQASDVMVLVDYVQQASVQAVDNLANLIGTEPMMAGSAAAAVLITVLMMRTKNRRADDGLSPLPSISEQLMS